jgi:acyl-CoA reductase-like NAD-dependent aldehyde dehydrogenase
MAPSATSTTNGSEGKLDFTTFKNTINGKLVGGGDGQTRHGINPATKKPNPEIPVATKEDLDAAVAAAATAFKSWSRTPQEERVKAVNDYAAALAEYESEFAKLLTIEQGKPVSNIPNKRR